MQPYNYRQTHLTGLKTEIIQLKFLQRSNTGQPMTSSVSTRVGDELFRFNTSLFCVLGSQKSSLGTAGNRQLTRRFSWELSWKGQPRENHCPRSHQSRGQRKGEAELSSRRCWMNSKLCPVERPLRAPAALQSWTQSHVLLPLLLVAACPPDPGGSHLQWHKCCLTAAQGAHSASQENKLLQINKGTWIPAQQIIPLKGNFQITVY